MVVDGDFVLMWGLVLGCVYIFGFCVGVLFEIEGFWGGVVFELLGVGEDFVSRWGLVSGCSFGVGVVIFLFVLCYGMFVEIEFFGVGGV